MEQQATGLVPVAVDVLLTQGQRILEQLFPGLGAELTAAGASTVDWIADWSLSHSPLYKSGDSGWEFKLTFSPNRLIWLTVPNCVQNRSKGE